MIILDTMFLTWISLSERTATPGGSREARSHWSPGRGGRGRWQPRKWWLWDYQGGESSQKEKNGRPLQEGWLDPYKTPRPSKKKSGRSKQSAKPKKASVSPEDVIAPIASPSAPKEAEKPAEFHDETSEVGSGGFEEGEIRASVSVEGKAVP